MKLNFLPSEKLEILKQLNEDVERIPASLIDEIFTERMEHVVAFLIKHGGHSEESLVFLDDKTIWSMYKTLQENLAEQYQKKVHERDEVTVEDVNSDDSDNESQSHLPALKNPQSVSDFIHI